MNASANNADGDEPETQSRSPHWRIGIMLGLSLVLHLWLAWRWQWPSPPVNSQEETVLQLQLQPPPSPPETTPPEPELATDGPPDEPEPVEPEPVTPEPLAETGPQPEPEAPPEATTRPALLILDSHALREQAREWLENNPELLSEEAEPPAIGRLRPELPRTLVAERALPLIPTPFSEVYLTGETEIIDQWENPDGSREVVVRTPNGTVLCGRRAAPELLEPLVEPIMLFRSC